MEKSKTVGATSIKGMLQNMHVDNMEVVQGKVISANPLKIQAQTDENRQNQYVFGHCEVRGLQGKNVLLHDKQL